MARSVSPIMESKRLQPGRKPQCYNSLRKVMGFTRLHFTVSHPVELDRSEEVELLVDTGALNSVVPRAILERLIGDHRAV